jgi:hypothetical protein
MSSSLNVEYQRQIIQLLLLNSTNASNGPYEFGITKKDLDSLRTNWKNFPNLTETAGDIKKAIASNRTLYGTKGISPDAIHMGPGDDS